MKNVTAKTGTPLAYSITSIDGQSAGIYWEFYWEIVDNSTNTPDRKGQILNNSVNSNKIFVTWLRKSQPNETFILKCHVKVKPSANVVTCEKDVYTNVIVTNDGDKLDENVVLTEIPDNNISQCKIYNSINNYKACCLGADKIKWIVTGGHILLDPNNLSSIVGSSAIKDANNGCSNISVIWDIKNSAKYSISAYGISGSNTSNGSTRIEKILGTDVITPIITFNDTLVLGEQDYADISYTLSDFYWQSFPEDYTINVWFKYGTYLPLKPGATGISDDDYEWSSVQNLGGGTIGYYDNLNHRFFTRTIQIPESYSVGTATKFRFKLINIEVVGPSEIEDCFVSSNGRGPYGAGWVLNKDYNNDLNLTHCPIDSDFPALPINDLSVPACSEEFVTGDIDIIAPPCVNTVILGALSPCKKPLPKFGSIVIMTTFPEFSNICYNNCLPVNTEFGSICITVCNPIIPNFAQVGTVNGINAISCFVIEPEFSVAPDICYVICDTVYPEYNNIQKYDSVIPVFNSSPGRTICVTVCNFDAPIFGTNPGVDEICAVDCFTSYNVTVAFNNISGGEDPKPELNELISITCQILDVPVYDNSPDICYLSCQVIDPAFNNIAAFGITVPEYSRSKPICLCIMDNVTVEFGSVESAAICYSSQILTVVGFAQLPCSCITPMTIFSPYIEITCQILETPKLDVDFPGNVTIQCQSLSTPTFTLSLVPGSILCYQQLTVTN